MLHVAVPQSKETAGIITKRFKTKLEISVIDRLPVCHKNTHTHTQERQRTCKGAVKKPQQIKPFPQAHIPRTPGNCHSSRLACCSCSYWSDLYRSTMLVFEIILIPVRQAGDDNTLSAFMKRYQTAIKSIAIKGPGKMESDWLTHILTSLGGSDWSTGICFALPRLPPMRVFINKSHFPSRRGRCFRSLSACQLCRRPAPLLKKVVSELWALVLVQKTKERRG